MRAFHFDRHEQNESATSRVTNVHGTYFRGLGILVYRIAIHSEKKPIADHLTLQSPQEDFNHIQDLSLVHYFRGSNELRADDLRHK